MRMALSVAGVLALLMGTVWFLQGVDVLPGSFMSGQRKWAVNGAVLFLVGVALLVVARRRRG